MTKARLGSQLPARSKKFSTLAGLIMPETVMPRPKRMPIRKAETRLFIALASDHVADDEDGDEGRQHEGHDRSQRARREPRQAAYAVPARAAVAEMHTDADEQPADDKRTGRNRD